MTLRAFGGWYTMYMCIGEVSTRMEWIMQDETRIEKWNHKNRGDDGLRRTCRLRDAAVDTVLATRIVQGTLMLSNETANAAN